MATAQIPVKPTILNVDDHEPGRYAITRILRSAEFEVREAGTGAEALHLVSAEPPDLVLLDVNLPDIHGFEVCRRIKADPATSRIPVLHLSATCQRPADQARGLEVGAESFLTEPIEPELLIATIKSLLRTRQAEEAHHRLAREWQATFDSISDGVAMLDNQGRIVRCNRRLRAMLNKAEHELVGRRVHELWGAGQAPPAPFAFARMLQSRRSEEMDLDSGQCIYHIRVDPVLDEAGHIAGAVYIVSDVTGPRRIEEQLQQQQRFEMVGNLAAGVAHDFNNLLTSILGHASLALADFPPSHPGRDRLEEVIRAGERAAHLTHQLLAYAGKGNYVLLRVDLGRLLQDMRDLMTASVSRKISLRLEIAPDLPSIEADVRQIQQLLMNLLLNAAEAIGDRSGAITIAAGAGERVEGDSEPAAGPHVWLEVRDNGCGMDETTRAQIFDPFFTTKFMGRGLGLAAVQGIVRGHRGAIQVESAPGAGTRVRVLFPAMEGSADPALPEARRKEPVATILVVDDEPAVRRVARSALERRGFRVLLAEHGGEAVDLVRRHGAEISAVLLDLTMPVMSGDEALEHIGRLQPGLKVIVSSGHDTREAARRLPAGKVAAFLQKPYTARALGEKIAAVLREPHTHPPVGAD